MASREAGAGVLRSQCLRRPGSMPPRLSPGHIEERARGAASAKNGTHLEAPGTTGPADAPPHPRPRVPTPPPPGFRARPTSPGSWWQVRRPSRPAPRGPRALGTPLPHPSSSKNRRPETRETRQACPLPPSASPQSEWTAGQTTVRHAGPATDSQALSPPESRGSGSTAGGPDAPFKRAPRKPPWGPLIQGDFWAPLGLGL